MSSPSVSMPELYASYKKSITENPALSINATNAVEVALKLISFFVADSIRNSHKIDGQLVSLLPILIQILSDRKSRSPGAPHRLELENAILEVCKVLFALSLGPKGQLLMAISTPIFKKYVSDKFSNFPKQMPISLGNKL